MNYNWITLATVLWVCSFAAEAGVGSNSVVNLPLITLHPNYVSDYFYKNKNLQPLPLLLPCLCDGGPVRFSWFRDKVSVKLNPIADLRSSSTPGLYFDAEPPSVHGLFNGSLIIVGGIEANTGAYQCFASLIAQPHIRTMSEIAHVHEKRWKNLQNQLVDKKTVTEGEYVKLPCPPKVMLPPPRVTWEVDNQRVQLIDNRRIVQDDQGTLHILSVMPNGSEFAGQLRCLQRNTISENYKGLFTHLTLDNSHGAWRQPKAEYVSSSPVYITAATGEQAVYCIFSGNPPPTVNWTRVDKRELGAGVVADGARLVFRNATLNDSATYQCAVSSAAPGFASSTTHVRNVTVVVRSAPRTLPGVTKASRVDKTVGDRVNLNCGAEGEPTPKYSWYFNTLPLDSSENKDVHQQLLSYIKSPKLDLIGLTKRSIGVYSCNVSNAIGYKFISFALNVFNESRLQATIYSHSKSKLNLIELRCTAQVDAGQRFDLYWKRLPNGDENKNASHYDNNRLTDKPQDGVYVSLIRSEATVKIDLNAINSTQQRLKWIVNRTYECVLETTTGNLSSHVFVALGQQQVVQDESIPGFRYWLALVGGAVALVFAVVCISIAFYYGCKTQGESYLVDKLERAHGNNPLAELKAAGFAEYIRPDD